MHVVARRIFRGRLDHLPFGQQRRHGGRVEGALVVRDRVDLALALRLAGAVFVLEVFDFASLVGDVVRRVGEGFKRCFVQA